jgi:hypothetical protein
MKKFDEIEFPTGTTVYIQGIGFQLPKPTILLGDAEHLELLKFGYVVSTNEEATAELLRSK